MKLKSRQISKEIAVDGFFILNVFVCKLNKGNKSQSDET